MSLISESRAWNKLKEHAETIKKRTHLRLLLEDEERNQVLTAEFEDLFMDFARQNVTQETMDLLFELAETAGLRDKLAAMASGEHINSTEDRAVMHMALRAPANKCMMVDGKNVVEEVHQVLQSIAAFTEKVREGTAKGATGKKIVNFISVGIGGSYLGPEFVFEALRHESNAKKAANGRVLRFLANVDPVDVARATDGLEPEETMVIVISKTFTTAETMLNARTLKKWLLDGMSKKASEDVIKKHMVAVSAAIPKAESFGIDKNNVFGFWDWVGGRYSVSSAVGVLPLALQYGFQTVEKFLAGAHSIDMHLLDTPLQKNIPVLMGLLGLWNSSFLGHTARAILPYSQALLRFSAHIQQLDMESNGKRVTIDGVELPFNAGEINFGEPGTNGQHSFYQLIHQGRVIPCEFIGFIESQHPTKLDGEVVSNHDELMSNFFAQPDALAKGKSLDDLTKEGVPETIIQHKVFSGNRPSLSLLFKSLNAYTCGQLLALYEHRTAVQGFIWNINSFDQWGVELGKVLANKVRQQLFDARKSSASVSGFNSSTQNLLQRYLASKQKA